MITKWLHRVNGGIALLALLFLFLAVKTAWQPSPEIDLDALTPPPIQKKAPLPPFTMDQEKYDQIGGPALSLTFAPMTLQLPNLRPSLTYHGRNSRPDADLSGAKLHFSMTGDSQQASIAPKAPLYLVQASKPGGAAYQFSPGNTPSRLWITASPEDDAVLINVFMKGEKKQLIAEPKANQSFSVKSRGTPRSARRDWEIGEQRVDGTLLARQKARWYGQDLFLDQHGGKEYEHLQEKQRIDFNQEEETYSLYVAPKDLVIWKDARWVVAAPDEETQEYPLLIIHKMTDRLLSFQLWDAEGRGKITLNLIKAVERWNPKAIGDTFKFVGSRKRSEFIFDVNGQRLLIRPSDWIVLTEDGWVKLVAPEQVDAYVNRQLVGPLFVFHGLIKKEGAPYLSGMLFNSSRTAVEQIDLPIQQASSGLMKDSSPAQKEEEQEEDDDDN